MVTRGEVYDPVGVGQVETDTVTNGRCERQRETGASKARVEESKVDADAIRVLRTRDDTRMTVVSSIRTFDHAAE